MRCSEALENENSSFSRTRLSPLCMRCDFAARRQRKIAALSTERDHFYMRSSTSLSFPSKLPMKQQKKTTHPKCNLVFKSHNIGIYTKACCLPASYTACTSTITIAHHGTHTASVHNVICRLL